MIRFAGVGPVNDDVFVICGLYNLDSKSVGMTANCGWRQQRKKIFLQNTTKTKPKTLTIHFEKNKMKTDKTRRLTTTRKCCPGDGCCSSFGNWCGTSLSPSPSLRNLSRGLFFYSVSFHILIFSSIFDVLFFSRILMLLNSRFHFNRTHYTVRNWIHVILLTAAVAAVVGAILGSLDSCNTELRNVTVTRSVEIVNHLDAIVLIDGSGSMCYDDDALGNAGAGCTDGSCPSGSSGFCRTKPGCTCDEDRWSQAKTGIEYLNNQLNTSMNENVISDTNKIQTGLITWSTTSATSQGEYLITNAPLQSGVTATNDAAASANLPTGGTYWGTGLCQCYKQLQTNGYDGANKLCFLMADGALNGEDLGAGTCASSDGNRGADGDCPCDYLWNDVSTLGWTSSQGYPATDSTFVEEFMKSQNITISSILVGTGVDGERIFQAASCDGISWNSGTGAPSTPCDNY